MNGVEIYVSFRFAEGFDGELIFDWLRFIPVFYANQLPVTVYSGYEGQQVFLRTNSHAEHDATIARQFHRISEDWFKYLCRGADCHTNDEQEGGIAA